jgi:hypothetical protein
MIESRLVRLIHHLETGTQGHAKFDCDFFNADTMGQPFVFETAIAADFDYKTGCGYFGNALGEMPLVDPEQWCFAGYSKMPVLHKYDQAGPWFGSPLVSAAEYFDVSMEDAEFLFLNRAPTKEDAAALLRVRLIKDRVYGA